ncbi:MAG: hypothetical protein ACI8Y3_001928, partial [Paraglaciecola sp.]
PSVLRQSHYTTRVTLSELRSSVSLICRRQKVSMIKGIDNHVHYALKISLRFSALTFTSKSVLFSF